MTKADAPPAVFQRRLGFEQAGQSAYWRKDSIIRRSIQGTAGPKKRNEKDQEAKPMMILISDGRANMAISGNVKKELKDISEQNRLAGVHTIVIGTEVVGSSFMEMRLGCCKDIAKASGLVEDIIPSPV
jgi:hypothetical protein